MPGHARQSYDNPLAYMDAEAYVDEDDTYVNDGFIHTIREVFVVVAQYHQGARPMASKKRFICTDCAAEFSRKDHAKRHKLSHSRPRYLCLHPGCGLFFHRRDVLRRHEAVHRPENDEKRRRPRRGPLPPSLPGLEEQSEQQPASTASASHKSLRATATTRDVVRGSDDASVPENRHDRNDDWNDGSEDHVDPACLCDAEDGTVCVHCSTELVRLANGRLPTESQGAINFCLTHYIQSQLKWFPFIRPSSLRKDWLLNGRALVIAALGARAIKEYKSLSGVLWAETLRRRGKWVASSVSGSKNVLSEFQTKILLLEYFQWSEESEYPDWVKPTLDIMIHEEADDLVNMLTDMSSDTAADTSVDDELGQQEIRWTLWKFYCAMTRTTLLGLKLQPPRLFQTLELPGEPKQLLVLAGCTGKESVGPAEGLRSEYRVRSLTLPRVLSMLLADQHKRVVLSDTLSMTGKYIVLHAILHLSDNMVEKLADAKAAQEEPLGWRVETRERLYLLVLRWRQCFWVPPEVLWHTPFPEFGSLQSIMFVIYLAVRISQPVCGSPNEERCSRQPYTQHAMRCVVTMHMDMKINNLTEVAAKGRWFLDGATWRTGAFTAAYLIEWFHDRAKFGFGDEDIEILQSLESVMALYSHVGSYNGLSYSPARLAQLERSVIHLWTMILGTKKWPRNEI